MVGGNSSASNTVCCLLSLSLGKSEIKAPSNNDATFFEPGESTSSSSSALNGQDAYYGAGVGFYLSKNLNLDIEYLDMTLSEMDFGDNEDKLENKVTSIGASLALKF